MKPKILSCMLNKVFKVDLLPYMHALRNIIDSLWMQT